MTLEKVIRLVDGIKPNSFPDEAKTMWINEVEGMVQTEVLLFATDQILVYDWERDRETKLLVEPPHDKIYWAYLTAMIDFANGEYNRYQNTLQMFNASFSEFACWFADRYRPADTAHLEEWDGEKLWYGYYLSAYGLEVKHGYEGSEEEWVASLHGAAGKDGADGENGKDGYTPQKGVDYWTKEDQQALAEEAVRLLPVYGGEVGGETGEGEVLNGKDGYTPVKGVDYWTEADKESIVQEVVTALGTPVFGRVDVNNNIILTGELAAGIYTLKYEDAEGNQTLIGKLEHTGEAETAYTNQIPISTDTDGSVYNLTGYKTASRLNSSGIPVDLSNTAATNPAFVTGFIPCRKGDVIRLGNCFVDTNYRSDDSYYGQDTAGLRITFYDSSKTMLGAAAWSEYEGGSLSDYAVDENGYITQFALTDSNMAYVRLCLGGNPETAIVTINEVITD